ncbi:MAG: VOC family protein [Actinomycetes bacterium]
MSVRTSYEPGTPCWADLATADVEAATRFYGAVFGWDFREGPPESGPYVTCVLDGEPVAGIMPAAAPERDATEQPTADQSTAEQSKPEEATDEETPAGSVPAAWTTYLATEDVDATTKRVVDAGGTVTLPPVDAMEEGRMAVVTDPTGAVFGLWQPRRHIGARRVDEPGSLTWTELATGDPAAAWEFYRAVFGFERDTIGDGTVTYSMLTIGEAVVAGVMPRHDAIPAVRADPAWWLLYFAVADADATIRSVTDHGGSVLHEPVDTPYGRMSVLADPDGAGFAVIASDLRA